MSVETILKVNFVLEGKSPFLFHADHIEAADELEEWRKRPENKKVSRPGDDRSPPWTWQTYLYRDGQYVALPTDNMMACLRQAGAKVVMQKQTTYKESTQSGLWTEAEFFQFQANGEQISLAPIEAMKNLSFAEQARRVQGLGFSLFCKRARVGQSKHIRVRPKVENWSVRGSLEVFDHAPELTFEVLQQIFKIAGRIGLCDWRPGCRTPGRFGMFVSHLERD